MRQDDYDAFGRTIHLLRPWDEKRSTDSYCGEVCFGMGGSATSNPLEANCRACFDFRAFEELQKELERQQSPLDTFVRDVETKPQE